MKQDFAFSRVSLNFFSVFAIVSIVIPYLQVYLNGVGWSVERVGILLAFLRGAGVLGPLFFGVLARRGLPVKRLVTVVCIALAGLFLGLLHTSSFAGTAVIVVLFGFSFSVLIPFTDSFANTILPDPDRQYGKARVFGTFGFLVPTIIYGFVGFPYRYAPAAILYTGIGMLVFHLITVQLYPAQQMYPKKPGAKEGRLGAAFWVLIAVLFINRIAMSAHYSFFSLYLKDVLGIDGIGWFWIIGPLSEIPIIFLGGALLKRFSVSALIGASFAAVAIRLGVYAFFPSAVPVLIVQLLHCFTFGTFHIAAMAGIRRSVSPAMVTTAMTVFAGAAMELPAIIGSIAGGFLIAALGYRSLYSIASAAAVIGIVLLLFADSFFKAHFRKN